MRTTLRPVADRRSALGLLVFVAIVVAAACDNPTRVEHHAAAEGFAIRLDDTEIYRWTLDDDGAPATLELVAGSHDVAFVLLGTDGLPLPHEDHEGEEEELSVTADHPGILTWTPDIDTLGELHEHLEFHGTLDALVPGQTTLHLCLAHGDHCDFETPGTGVPVTIEP